MKFYKIFLLIALPALFLMSSTCNNDSALNLKEGESTTRKINGVQYDFTVTGIQDNRCPKDVKCIRAGEAFVNASIKTGNSAEQLMQFCTGVDCQRGAVGNIDTIRGASVGLEVKLLSVTPYPGEGTSGAAKTAKFTIRKL